MLRIKFYIKQLFRIFTILKNNGMAPICNLFMRMASRIRLNRLPRTIITRKNSLSRLSIVNASGIQLLGLVT